MSSPNVVPTDWKLRDQRYRDTLNTLIRQKINTNTDADNQDNSEQQSSRDSLKRK